jgi:hypothetical protein
MPGRGPGSGDVVEPRDVVVVGGSAGSLEPLRELAVALPAERDKAWQRILAAARRYDVEVSESDWRDLAKGGKDRKR